ncbi:MAG: ABC transporter permease [Patescibacteria group bacterium]
MSFDNRKRNFRNFTIKNFKVEILRNIWRRKFRSALTILGIAIGIFAFTVMGSMSLKINKMISGGKKFMTGQITIMPKGTNLMSGQMGKVLPASILDEISKIEGIESVLPNVEIPLEEPDPNNPTNSGGGSFGPPPTIYGIDKTMKFANKNWNSLEMKTGKMIDENSKPYEVAVGYTIASKNKLSVGSNFEIRGKVFKVIGIMDQTMTGPDYFVYIDINEARDLLIESDPFLKEQSENISSLTPEEMANLPENVKESLENLKTFNIQDLTTSASVIWKDGYDEENVKEIRERFKGDVLVLSPKQMGEMIDNASKIFYAIILGSAVIALLVGSFSIVNTMIMSVSERAREIGIKKAIGASRKSIALEYMGEAGIIGFFGGVIGVSAGTLVTFSINKKTASDGAEIFLIDIWFMLGVMGFSLVLGLVAGVIPAIRASKLKVVETLHEM